MRRRQDARQLQATPALRRRRHVARPVFRYMFGGFAVGPKQTCRVTERVLCACSWSSFNTLDICDREAAHMQRCADRSAARARNVPQAKSALVCLYPVDGRRFCRCPTCIPRTLNQASDLAGSHLRASTHRASTCGRCKLLQMVLGSAVWGCVHNDVPSSRRRCLY